MKNSLLTTFFLLGIGLNIKAQMPAVTLKTIDGKEIKTDTLSNGGKPMIIDFFATWCKPCNRELSAIAEVYEDWQNALGYLVQRISCLLHIAY